MYVLAGGGGSGSKVTVPVNGSAAAAATQLIATMTYSPGRGSWIWSVSTVPGGFESVEPASSRLPPSTRKTASAQSLVG